jgi:multidrug efflux pump subunit AcrB
LSADDVVAAIRSQNVQASAGVIGGPPYKKGVELQIPVNVEGRLQDTEQFGEMIIKRTLQGVVTRLKNVVSRGDRRGGIRFTRTAEQSRRRLHRNLLSLP